MEKESENKEKKGSSPTSPLSSSLVVRRSSGFLFLFLFLRSPSFFLSLQQLSTATTAKAKEPTHDAVAGAVQSVSKQPRRPLHAALRSSALNLPLFAQFGDVAPQLLLGIQVQGLGEGAQNCQGLVTGESQVVRVVGRGRGRRRRRRRRVIFFCELQKKRKRALHGRGVRNCFLDGAPPVGAAAPAEGRGEELVAASVCVCVCVVLLEERRGKRRVSEF